jgi:hypothetical protein
VFDCGGGEVWKCRALRRARARLRESESWEEGRGEEGGGCTAVRGRSWSLGGCGYGGAADGVGWTGALGVMFSRQLCSNPHCKRTSPGDGP